MSLAVRRGMKSESVPMGSAPVAAAAAKPGGSRRQVPSARYSRGRGEDGAKRQHAMRTTAGNSPHTLGSSSSAMRPCLMRGAGALRRTGPLTKLRFCATSAAALLQHVLGCPRGRGCEEGGGESRKLILEMVVKAARACPVASSPCGLDTSSPPLPTRHAHTTRGPAC